MYEAHFGLQGRPFDTGIAHEVDVFRGSRQNTIIDKTKLALAASDSVVTFFGPPGVGKTTLALSAVRSTSTRIALAWLSAMPTNANELLELLLVELGINAHRASRIERLQMWRQYLGEMSATESRVFVIAERTEELAPEVLRALDALTGADASGSSGANVVLLGHQGLDAFLGVPSLESLRQRIRLRQRVEPFSAAELTEYLRYRVAQMGGDFDKLFAPGAAAAVFRHSSGVARLANTLCEAALTGAAAARKPAITSDLIAEVAVEMLGIAEPAPAPQSAPATPAAQTAAAAPSPPAPTPPPAPVPSPASVTFASVAIDIRPAKAASVAVPATASAAPRVAEAAAAEPKAHAPAPRRESAATPPAAAPTAPVSPPPTPRTSTVAPVTASEPVAKPEARAVAPAAAPVADVPVAPTPVAIAEPPVVARPTPERTPPPVAAPAVAVTAATIAATKSAPAPRMPPDFDATATDIPDVSSFDFPVLTDAVEDTAPRTPVARAPVAPPPAPVPPAPVARTIVAPPSASRAAPPPARPAASAPPPPTRRLLEPKAAAPNAPPPAPKVEEEPDALRQTQTMRAISQAKSIDDVSDSMAETLFGEAELDFLSAALASAVGENEEAPAAAPAQSPQTPPPTSSPADELMDLFNLGPDAPLELIDDSATPQSDQRKTAARRS